MLAARCLIATVRGAFTPSMALRKPRIVTPSVYQGTDVSPAKEIMDHCRWWEAAEPRVYVVSVAFGFAYADVPDVGDTVIAVNDDDPALAETVAQDVSDLIWCLRTPFAGKRLPTTAEGVSRAITAARAGRTPVVLADHSDRTGDGTPVLRELIAQGAEDFYVIAIAHPRAIAEIAATAGDTVTQRVGGYATN